MCVDELNQALQELDEDGGKLLGRIFVKPAPSFKGVPEADEFLLNQDAESIECAVEGVHNDRTQGGHLAYSVEAIRLFQQDML